MAASGRREGSERPSMPLSALERSRAFLDLLRGGGNYDEVALEGLEVVDASPGRVVCRLPAAPKHANR